MSKYSSITERPPEFDLNLDCNFVRGLAFAGLGRFSKTLRFHDSSPYGNHGTLTNMAVPATATSGWAWDNYLRRWTCRFDGSNEIRSVIPIRNYPTNSNSPGTFVALIKPTSITGSQGLLSRGEVVDNNYTQTFGLFGNKVSVGYDGYLTAITSATSVVVDEWAVIGVIVDATNVVFCVNRTLESAKAHGLGAGVITATNPAWQLGKSSRINDSIHYHYSGLISDCFYWPFATSPGFLLSACSALADPSDVMLSGLIKPPRRIFFEVPFIRRTVIAPTVINRLNLGGPGTSILPKMQDGLGLDTIVKGILPKRLDSLELDGRIISPIHHRTIDALTLTETIRPSTQINEQYASFELSETIDTSESVLANPETRVDELILEEVISYNRNATRLITESLVLVDYLFGYIELDGNIIIRFFDWNHFSWDDWDTFDWDDWNSDDEYTVKREHIYAPILSEGSRFIRTYYGLTSTGEITLSYGPLSVTLRAPTFNNTQSLNQTRIQRESINGKMKIYRDPIWPQIETFSWSFEGLTEEQKDEFLDFIYSTLGLEVNILDYEGRDWIGVISNPQVETSEELRECGYKVNLEFEGEIND